MMTMTRTTMFAAAVLLLTPQVYGLSAAEASTAEAGQDSAYTEGTRAMNDQRWQDAVAAFEKVIKDKDKGRKKDAAFYWKAYSLKKLGNTDGAVMTCDQLHSQFAASRWNNDCRVLSMPVNTQVYVDSTSMTPMPPMPPLPPTPPMPRIDLDNPGMDNGRGHKHGQTADEDIKLLAMNSLLNQDPAKAIPLLRGMLAGNQSPSMKKHALFVLSQSKAPEATAILHDAVLGKMGIDVQREAIQSMGIFRGKQDNGTLVDVYRGTSDEGIKRSVISALFISQDAPRLVDLAKGEKDLEMKRRIVSQLAMMRDKVAMDYMMELLN